jgi:hypothetical protein
MADTAAPTTSRSSRTATAKRRAGAVSSDTENKLARAAKSAQRLAQLSDVSRDDSTGDLFGDDPARAALEAMNIDTRQGTLAGFELPDDVLAAVGMPIAGQGDETVSSEAPASAPAAQAKASRNARGARPSEAAVEAPASLLASRDEVVPQAASAESPSLMATPDASAVPESTAALDAVLAPSSIEVASAISSVAPARRQAAARPGESAVSRTPRAGEAEATPDSAEPAASKTIQPETPPQIAQPAAARRAPDLDWARATAFADTVDALYGVIADQRRTAGDHSRRMKWLLSVVVAALLVTIAIGITQTALLMRLTRESAAQQQRIEDMLRSQQATLATLADAAASANARTPAAAPAPSAPAAPVTRQPLAPTQSAAKHTKPQQHLHKPKATATH